MIMNTTTIKNVFLLFLSFTACSSEDPVDPVGDGVPLEVSASITETVPTRAESVTYEKKSFETNDKISIWNKTSGSEAAASTYQLSAAGQWLPGSGVTSLTTSGSDEVFSASYVPDGYNGIQVDQATAAKYKSSIRLADESPVDGNKVTFAFVPEVAKITIRINYPDKTHTGESVQLVGSTALVDDKSATEEARKTVAFYAVSNTGDQHVYIGVVLPGTNISYTINVTSSVGGVSDKKQSDTFTKTLEAGYNYTYIFSSTDKLILEGVTVDSFGTDEVDNGTGGNWSAT